VERGSLRSVFGELAELERAGVISGWAVVGAVAALFHAEVTRTYDLDVAVLLPPSPGKLLLLTPLYERLREHGFEAEGEHVRIHGVPVQFISLRLRRDRGPGRWRGAPDRDGARGALRAPP